MKKLKIKDVVLVALLTALYMVFYMVGAMGSMLFGAFGHAISPGICAFLGGSVILFMSRKVGRFGQYTIMVAIVMLLCALMGGGYLPWLITSMVSAVLADLIASGSNRTPVWRVAVASGIMHVGQAWGAIIPSWFFLEQYKKDWIARGQSPKEMDSMVKATQGIMGGLASVVVFLLAFAGVWLGYYILRKHLEKTIGSDVKEGHGKAAEIAARAPGQG